MYWNEYQMFIYGQTSCDIKAIYLIGLMINGVED